VSETIYLDHAATTPPDPAVLAAMAPWQGSGDGFGNASALYGLGREAARAVEEARARVAGLIRARPMEIVFTSGGTEANNAAIKGVVLRPGRRRAHVITTAVEHKAVIAPVDYLEALGTAVTVVPVNSEGRVDPGVVAGAVRDDTVLISVMHANNEIGTVQPVAEIGRIAREAGAVFHVDAVQTVGRLVVDVEAMGCDLLSLSGHKFYGPKGAGALYVRGGAGGSLPLAPLLHGGFQEEGLRSGTLNTAAIVGLGAAALRAGAEERAERETHVRALRDRLVEGVLRRIPDTVPNGPRRGGLPNIASFSFPGVDGEAAVIALDWEGVSASTGSACTAGLKDPSHVLLAIGHDPDLARGTIRFSLGKDTTESEIDRVLDILPRVVERLRQGGKKKGG